MSLGTQYYDFWTYDTTLWHNIWTSAFLTPSIDELWNQLQLTSVHTYSPHFKELYRKGSGRCYWNGIIWSWATLSFKENVIFKIKLAPRDFTNVNEKLLRWNFSGKIKIDKIS